MLLFASVSVEGAREVVLCLLGSLCKDSENFGIVVGGSRKNCRERFRFSVSLVMES